MAIIKCKQGHFYDNRKNKICPFCKKESVIKTEGKTITQNVFSEKDGHSFQIVTPYSKADSEVTVGVFSPKKGNDFVVGWLVCIKGANKGRDYRLHHGFNRIGRGYKNDVVLEDDLRISRSAHCSVVYEDRTNSFYLRPEAGQITYYKGILLDEPIKLISRDSFEIGDSALEFIAFCEGSKKWEK